MKKLKIDYLITNNNIAYTPCPKGNFPKDPDPNGINLIDECSIKHIGRQIYLVGYFDFHKQGYATMGKQSPINQYILLFPNDIKRIVYK
jgi:hypothetical protein